MTWSQAVKICLHSEKCDCQTPLWTSSRFTLPAIDVADSHRCLTTAPTAATGTVWIRGWPRSWHRGWRGFFIFHPESLTPAWNTPMLSANNSSGWSHWTRRKFFCIKWSLRAHAWSVSECFTCCVTRDDHPRRSASFWVQGLHLQRCSTGIDDRAWGWKDRGRVNGNNGLQLLCRYLLCRFTMQTGQRKNSHRIDVFSASAPCGLLALGTVNLEAHNWSIDCCRIESWIREHLPPSLKCIWVGGWSGHASLFEYTRQFLPCICYSDDMSRPFLAKHDCGTSCNCPVTPELYAVRSSIYR